MAEEQVKTQASLVATLSEMNRGRDLLALDGAYQELLEAVKANGGKGKLTVVITAEFLNALDNDATQMAMTVDCKLTKPKLKVVPAVFFVDDRCAVTKEDPNQLKLDLQRVADRAENVRPMARKEAN